MLKPQISELVFFWIMLGIVGAFTFVIMSPYLTPLFLAGVFAILFSPIHRYLLKRTHGNDGRAALFTVLVVLIVVLIPLIFLGTLMFQEVLSIYESLAQGNVFLSGIDRSIAMVGEYVQRVVPTFEIRANVYMYFESLIRWVVANLNNFFGSILAFIFQIFIVNVGMFFLYRDGKRLRAFALKWSPLNDDYDNSIIMKIETAVSSVVRGALATAIAQGVMLGIGFAIFGIPNPVLWGVIGTIAALIPLLGTAIITMPAGAWLLFTGHLGMGIGLIAWGVLCVGLIDNVLSPFLMKRGMNVHPFLILLSVFGGLAYFGPVGFLVGPIVLAFFFTLLEVYPLIIKGRGIDAQ